MMVCYLDFFVLIGHYSVKVNDLSEVKSVYLDHDLSDLTVDIHAEPFVVTVDVHDLDLSVRMDHSVETQSSVQMVSEHGLDHFVLMESNYWAYADLSRETMIDFDLEKKNHLILQTTDDLDHSVPLDWTVTDPSMTLDVWDLSD